MGANEAIIRAISAAAIRPVTVDEDGKITGVGTEISLNFVQGEKFSIGKTGTGAAAAATSTDKIEAVAGNGITVAYDKQTKRIDKDGNTLANTAGGGGGGGGGGDLIGITAFQVKKAHVQLIHEYIDNPWMMWVKVGENVTTAEEFEVYLLGTVSNAPEWGAQPETAVQWTFDLQGGTAFSLEGATLPSALAWSPAAITPVGESAAITPTPLAEANVSASTYTGSGAAKGLLSGRAVIL